MAPPIKRSQRQLHHFVLPSDLKWFTKNQGTTGSPQRRPWRASSSRRRPPWADDDVPAAGAAEQPSPPKEPPVIAGMSGNIPNPSPRGSSSSGSRRASSWPCGEPTTESGPMIFKATASASPPQKPSALRIKFTTSKSGGFSSKRGSSASGGKPPPPPVSFNVLDRELNCIDLLNSGFQLDKDKSADSKRPVSFASEVLMIEEFDKASSAASTMDIDQGNTHENEGPKVEKIPEDIKGKKECEEKEPTLEINKGKKEEKPIRTYVRSLRKKLEEQEKRLERVMQRNAKDEEHKPDVPKDANSDDLNAKIWNLRIRKPDRKDEVLNLDKNKLGSSSNKDEGQSVKDQKGKQVVTGGESKRGDEKANAEANKKKDKAKEPMQEQQQTEEVKFPKVNVQLSPEEIADDLFALGIGPRPPRRPNRRTRYVQRNIDQVTPGMWLANITMDRYKVPAETTKKGKKRH